MDAVVAIARIAAGVIIVVKAVSVMETITLKLLDKMPLNA